MKKKNKNYKILVVDDSENTREILKRNLEFVGYTVEAVENVPKAMSVLEQDIIDLVITDYKMPGMDGMELVSYVKEYYRETEVIMITGYATIEKAIEAVKLGAEEYLPKPFTDEELYKAVETALKKSDKKSSEKYTSKFYGFHDLMPFKVQDILLVSSKYDAFVLEEDGNITERVYGDYVDLEMRSVPRITQVSSAKDAFSLIEEKKFDLVLTMPIISGMSARKFCRKVKQLKPDLKTVMLTYAPVTGELLRKIKNEKSIDKIFYWQGDSRLLVSIIKYIEDQVNVDYDSKKGVKAILFIEDSPWFYSFFLPLLYTEILNQTNHLIMEGFNTQHRVLRLRARPKILMAETFEEANDIYTKYKNNLLGIISDMGFPKNGEVDPMAGLTFVKSVKNEIFDLPIMLQSNEKENRKLAYNNNLSFIYKNSPKLLPELRSFMLSNFGFGDFIFRNPDGNIIAKASSIEELAKLILIVPKTCFEYHSNRNHISIWLRARTEFSLAEKLRDKKISDYNSIEEARQDVYEIIQNAIDKRKEGVIIDKVYIPKDENVIVKLGKGSLGGKGRGLAFLNSLITEKVLKSEFPEIKLTTPDTFVICTDVFEEFLEMNNIKTRIESTSTDKEIAEIFLNSNFPEKYKKDLKFILKNIYYPLAVRSSSLLEDSQNMPFAGIYKTFMIPNCHSDSNVRLNQLLDAIKLVYASVFQNLSKTFAENTDLHFEEEQMAVIIQQIVGTKKGNLFFPSISGVAQSTNFYPVTGLKYEDGLANIAIGLGKSIVEGEKVYTFSPKYPENNPPFSSAEELLKYSQSEFYALDLSEPEREVVDNEEYSLKKVSLFEEEFKDLLIFSASTYSPDYRAIRDTISIEGPRVITFAPLLKYNLLPFAEVLKSILYEGESAFGCPVEIEFSLKIFLEPEKRGELNLLQIRPLTAKSMGTNVKVGNSVDDFTLIYSHSTLGNGTFKNINHIVEVKKETFSVLKTREIAKEVGEINKFLKEKNKKYLLIGYGRWGTQDPSLGIPVYWDQISNAEVIVEACLENFKITPSQGSHFFHNMLSLGLGYLHFPGVNNKDYYNPEILKNIKVVHETNYVKCYETNTPLDIRIDGKKSKGIINIG